ncbi:MAG: HD domain-containing protein [Prevotellaceae bacterium]|nr:HD domain-containing protein [Prevotellaceae bacterium]
MRLLSDAELAKLLDKDIFHTISEAADSLGLECYVVGGYVRDLFLERPSNDIDVVVVGSGIGVARRLKERLGKRAVLSVFRNFGTAQVKYRGQEIEFVGARKESYSHDSRKPHVEDGTLEDDQNRRDFTINALAVCLNRERFGQLVDPFNGIADLEDGIICTPLDPSITFSDDPLRMLRCIRFATQLKFYIEDNTFDALSRHADRIKIISGERVEEELNKIMLAEEPSRGFVDLHRCGLLRLLLPELADLDIVETRNGRAHKNNFYHTLEVLDNVCNAQRNHLEQLHKRLETADDDAEKIQIQADIDHLEAHKLWLRWAALLHDIGKTRSKRWNNALGWTFHNHNFIGAKMVPVIFRRLKLPMDTKMKYVQKLVDLHMRPIAIADDEVTDSAVRRLVNDADDDIDDLMMLCEADITSKNRVKKARFLENFRLVREKITDLKERDYKRELQPCIDGNEIMELFSLKPSREVGELKAALKDAVLDNRVPNEREPLMALLRQKAAEMGIAMP